tara:strand:+ start:1380 stop:2297 length:918 start_codon:yes stop_codon:yes gene_type:complete
LNIDHQLLKKKAKSFYFASIFLPRKSFKNCNILYSFCREIDDIADGKNKNKKKILKSFLNIFLKDTPLKGSSHKPIKSLIKSNKIYPPCLIELINGVLSDTKRKVIIRDEIQLINYAYLVAGTVGLMMAHLLGNKNIHGYKHAVDLGIAMQLTNIMRDIIEDAKIDRVYIPQSWIKLNTKIILSKNHKSFSAIIYATDKLYLLSEAYYKSAMAGLAFLPIRGRFAILLALNTYRNIGNKIIKKKYSNLHRREFINIFEKFKCLFRTIIIFLFNYRVHLKNYNHNSKLHAKINKKSFLKRTIYEKK